MSPKEYKQKLRQLFTDLSKKDSESAKLKKIDTFRRQRGIRRHLKLFILLAAFWSTMALTNAQQNTLIPSLDDPKNADLAKKFQTGKFEIFDIPGLLIYLIDFFIYLGGGIAVLFIVIGGYQYMLGGMSDDKESGKKTLMYALGGFTISVLAWTIVNVVQVFVTNGDMKAPPAKEVQQLEKEKETPTAPAEVGELVIICPNGEQVDAVKAYIVANEGVRTQIYSDKNGSAIGVGHKCKTNDPNCSRTLSNAQIRTLFEQDYTEHKNKITSKLANFETFNAVRQGVLIDITFNMGPDWLDKFPKMKTALESEDWVEASRQLLSAKNGTIASRYLKDVKQRAKNNAEMIRTGKKDKLITKAKEIKNDEQQTEIVCGH